MINMIDGLTFDDVLLLPKYSEVKSRSNIDISVELSKGIKLKFPLIPSNMKTITGMRMAETIYNAGSVAILHRFMSWEDTLKCIKDVGNLKNGYNHIGFSVGVKEYDYNNVDCFADHRVKILCVDVAHGDSKQCVEMTKYIAKKYPHIFLISGNVATGDGAKRLWEAGADCVKCGVGPGSICSTRVETGNGSPQLTALEDCARAKYITEATHKKYIMSDGGTKNAGDCVKALCFTDIIMAGNLFSGSEETPGEILSIDGKQYKNYVGSSTYKTNHIEGVASIVAKKGNVQDIIDKLCEGIKSGMSYQGVSNLVDLKKDPKFVRISSAGLIESHPHDVLVVK